MMENVSEYTLLWLPWLVVLSALAGWLALRAWRRSDGFGALRWSGWALVPPALLLTGTVRLVGRVTGEVAAWAANVVFNPAMWIGSVLGAVALAMILGGAALRRRAGPAAAGTRAKSPRAVEPSASSRSAPVDDDMAEIEEILRRRGI
jgi:hypothetical protein